MENTKDYSTAIKELDDIEEIDTNFIDRRPDERTVITNPKYSTDIKVNEGIGNELSIQSKNTDIVDRQPNNDILFNNQLLPTQQSIQPVDNVSTKLENTTLNGFITRLSRAYLEIIDSILTGTVSIEYITSGDRMVAIGVLMVITSIFFLVFQKLD